MSRGMAAVGKKRLTSTSRGMAAVGEASYVHVYQHGSGRILEASYAHESTSIVRLTFKAAVGY